MYGGQVRNSAKVRVSAHTRKNLLRSRPQNWTDRHKEASISPFDRVQRGFDPFPRSRSHMLRQHPPPVARRRFAVRRTENN